MSCDCVPADTLHPYSSKKFLCLSLSLSLSAPLTPPSPFTVKVILIKSSRRTELLIAPRRSSWFQIQIKAHRLFQKKLLSLPCIPPPPSSPLFHHVKYNLSNICVNRISLTLSLHYLSRQREEMKVKSRILYLHDHGVIFNWQMGTWTCTCTSFTSLGMYNPWS